MIHERQIINVMPQSSGNMQVVNCALTQWKDAVRYFENVKEPELVDFAIYEMEAARRKYMFLLKHAAMER
ncbi:MAG: DUF2508 family protein [Clostridia bacterium]